VLPVPLRTADSLDAKEVKYEDASGFAMTGYLALSETTADGPLPAVIVVQDGSKPTVAGYETRRARMWADLGYVAFAADVYGDNNGGYDLSTQGGEYFNLLRRDASLTNPRIDAAIDAVLANANVDPGRVALTGYCFGETLVISYATSGATRAAGIFSFHGGLLAGVAPPEEGPYRQGSTT